MRSDSLHVCAEWADETDGGTEGEDRGWTAGKQTGGEGGEGVRWRDFLLRGSLTLTMEPQPATRIALSGSVSHSHSLPRCLFLPLLLSLPLYPLARSESSLLAVTKMHHHLSAATHPLLPHVCSFTRQAGLKSQLRIEPSRLKPVSNLPSPPPNSPPQPPTCKLLATVEKRMRSRWPCWALSLISNQVQYGAMAII